MKDVLGFQFSSILLVENDVLITYSNNDDSQRRYVLPLTGKGITVRAAKTKKTIILDDVMADPDFIGGTIESGSELAVPVIIDDEVIGVLNVESNQVKAFDNHDARLMEILAQNVASAFFRINAENQRAEMELRLMTEKVRTEQEQELNQLKTRFMSTATHEIRTPLASIQGYIEIIKDIEGGLNENQRNYFDVIHRNVRRLTVLTDDLLDLQCLEENRIALNIEPVHIPDIVTELEEEFSPILSEKDQSLDVSIFEGEWSLDRLRVMQVLINLLSNASKFSPMGSSIKLAISEAEEGLRFDVKDQGIGVDNIDLEKLFDPFPGILVKGNTQGTGLGLSICKGIVLLHKGRIWAESDGLGKGMTFSFTIPRA